MSFIDRKEVVKTSEEISSLLTEAFEKHKALCRGFHKVDDELKNLKESSEREINKLKRENRDLTEELADAKKRIADLAHQVGRLTNEVQHWNRKACRSTSKPSETPSQRPNSEPSSQPSTSGLALMKVSSKSGLTNRSMNVGVQLPRQSPTTDPYVKASSEPDAVIFLDSDGEEQASPSVPSVVRRLSFSSSRPQRRSLDETKRKRSWEDDAVPETPTQPARPLQTNTCKVCQEYWREEDSRSPSKPNRYPQCKIHGIKERPPNTPENFWKQARLDPPRN
ncbi:hypothetical protein BV898_09662 [Hypsibius exemplaris]|uniref:DNA endonuclease RBBP8 n=1 Tax=Hypsibius exemplaris TaxID=2072580 RepID=A0A1W0WLU8_HYPEX|nr:hypothetical protein BV898_09662 [Hypsibius exemplaris]